MAIGTYTSKAADRKARRIFIAAMVAICVVPSGIAAVITASTAPVAFVDGGL